MGGLPPENKWTPQAEIDRNRVRLGSDTLIHPDICRNVYIVQKA